jgi:RES domain
MADWLRRGPAFFGRAGFTFINAAFTHTRPGGNRFSDEDRGAWYCGFHADTAIGEVSYHLTHELEAIGRFENMTDYAGLIADLFGPFHDLRALDIEVEPVLHKGPAITYPVGQNLARQLRTDHFSNGVIYPSIRHAGGTCLACFRLDIVQKLRQGGIWRLEWKGVPRAAVTRQARAVPTTDDASQAERNTDLTA